MVLLTKINYFDIFDLLLGLSIKGLCHNTENADFWSYLHPTYNFDTKSCTRCCKFAAFALSLWKQSALSTYTVLFSGGHAFGVSESVVLIVAHRALQMGPSIPAVYEWRGARKF